MRPTVTNRDAEQSEKNKQTALKNIKEAIETAVSAKYKIASSDPLFSQATTFYYRAFVESQTNTGKTTLQLAADACAFIDTLDNHFDDIAKQLAWMFDQDFDGMFTQKDCDITLEGVAKMYFSCYTNPQREVPTPQQVVNDLAAFKQKYLTDLENAKLLVYKIFRPFPRFGAEITKKFKEANFDLTLFVKKLQELDTQIEAQINALIQLTQFSREDAVALYAANNDFGLLQSLATLANKLASAQRLPSVRPTLNHVLRLYALTGNNLDMTAKLITADIEYHETVVAKREENDLQKLKDTFNATLPGLILQAKLYAIDLTMTQVTLHGFEHARANNGRFLDPDKTARAWTHRNLLGGFDNPENEKKARELYQLTADRPKHSFVARHVHSFFQDTHNGFVPAALQELLDNVSGISSKNR